MITLNKPSTDDLTELAVRYGVEVIKARLAGFDSDEIGTLLRKSSAARNAAEAGGASFTDINRLIDERLIQEIQARWEPGYITTLALDGDLDHPINALGDRIDLTGAAA